VDEADVFGDGDIGGLLIEGEGEEAAELLGLGLTTTVDDKTTVLEYEELGLGLTTTVD
jgi:hypothetical protein